MPELKRKKIELVAATLIMAAVSGGAVSISPALLLTLVAVGGLWALMLYEAISSEGWWRQRGDKISCPHLDGG